MPRSSILRMLPWSAAIWASIGVGFVSSLQAQSLRQPTLPTSPPPVGAAGTSEQAATPVEKLAEARVEFAARIERAQRAWTPILPTRRSGPPPEDLVMELELLKWIDVLFAQRMAAAARLVELQAEKGEVRDLSTSQDAAAMPGQGELGGGADSILAA